MVVLRSALSTDDLSALITFFGSSAPAAVGIAALLREADIPPLHSAAVVYLRSIGMSRSAAYRWSERYLKFVAWRGEGGFGNG